MYEVVIYMSCTCLNARISFISDPDPYCEVICEGNKVKTSVCKSTKNPTWNERMTFYQKKNEDIKIEV